MAFVALAIGLWPDHRRVVIGATVASGIFIGLNNTLVTTAVMSIAPVPRPVAAATYGFVRFIGGGLAPLRGRQAGRALQRPRPVRPRRGRRRRQRPGAEHCALRVDRGRYRGSPARALARIDAAEAVFEVPGLEEEAVIADEALREDRALNNPRPQ
jgi:ACDE family multidrug resistance protein